MSTERRALASAIAWVSHGNTSRRPMAFFGRHRAMYRARDVLQANDRPEALPRALTQVVVWPRSVPIPHPRAIRPIARAYAIVPMTRADVEARPTHGFSHADPFDDFGERWGYGLDEPVGSIDIVNRSTATRIVRVSMTLSSPDPAQRRTVTLTTHGNTPRQWSVDGPQAVDLELVAPQGSTTITVTVDGDLAHIDGFGYRQTRLVVADLRTQARPAHGDDSHGAEGQAELLLRQRAHASGYETIGVLDSDGSVIDVSIAGSTTGHPVFSEHAVPLRPFTGEADAWLLLGSRSLTVVERDLGLRP